MDASFFRVRNERVGDHEPQTVSIFIAYGPAEKSAAGPV